MKPLHTACTSNAGQSFDAKLILQNAGGAGENHVGRGRGDDDQIDLSGSDTWQPSLLAGWH